MTQKEKQILLKDLCARLPYGVKMKYIFDDGSHCPFELSTKILQECLDKGFLPYLRPMSSMTPEEEYEYHQYKNIDYLEICEMEHTKMLETTALCFSRAIEWLNKNGFDYRGLIPMGLAIESSKRMYKTK